MLDGGIIHANRLGQQLVLAMVRADFGRVASAVFDCLKNGWQGQTVVLGYPVRRAWIVVIRDAKFVERRTCSIDDLRPDPRSSDEKLPIGRFWIRGKMFVLSVNGAHICSISRWQVGADLSF